MAKLLLKEEVYKIVGAAIEVHRELQNGFAEAVYQEALELEFTDQAVPFEPQAKLKIKYKGRFLKKEYIADFVCFGSVLVELKCVPEIGSREEAQVLNYLKATGLRVAVIINFAEPGLLEWKRIVR